MTQEIPQWGRIEKRAKKERAQRKLLKRAEKIIVRSEREQIKRVVNANKPREKNPARPPKES